MSTPVLCPLRWNNSGAGIGHCFPGFPSEINFQLPTEAAGFITHILLAVFSSPYELSSSLRLSQRLPWKLLALKSSPQGVFPGNLNIRQTAICPTLRKVWEYDKTQLPAIRERTDVCNTSTPASTNCYRLLCTHKVPPAAPGILQR